MGSSILTIQAPYGGITRRTSYQTQAPFTSYDSINYWPIDTKTGRITTAVRPPLKLFGDTVAEVNLLSPVSGIAAGLPAKSFIASLNGALYYWDGATLKAATGAMAGGIDRGQFVSSAPIVNQVAIAKKSLPPIIFDYPSQTATALTATAGSVPVGATIVAGWQGALWHVLGSKLYASRVGVITDYDYSVSLTDLFGAFYTDGDYKGILAGPITALMPQTSNVMMVSTVSGTMAMRGHPRQGGVFEPVGNPYALGQGAWCQTPDGTLLILTALGLMSLAPEPGAVMAPVSRDKIPDELLGISYDLSDPLVTMVYDARWNGAHIYVRGAQEQAWLFDMNTGGFHKMEVGSYPFNVMEYADFITESTSGLLLGRYDGIRTYDRFATEDINSSLVMGPVKISQSTLMASRIDQIRVTFARDTPTKSGTMKVAVGMDGQDAVNRLLQGKHQYSIPLNALESSFGTCCPDVTGHAMVISFETSEGDLAIEEVTCRVRPVGQLRFSRSEQIAVTGAETDFVDGYIDLDTTLWRGYSEATPVTLPDESLPDYTHFLDLSLLPTSWWDEVRSEGGEDVRVSDGNNVQVPSMTIDFSLANKTGMLAFKMSQPTSGKKVRLWVGNSDAAMVPFDSTNGQHNVFDDHWRGFWPDAGGNSNVTRYSDNTATSNQANSVNDAFEPYWGQESGPMGAKATDCYLGGYTQWKIADWAPSQDLEDHYDWTFISAAKRADTGGITSRVLHLFYNLTQDRTLSAYTHEGNANTTIDSTNSTSQGAGSDDGGAAVGHWRHHAGTISNDADYVAYIDGIGKVAQSFTPSHPAANDLFMPGFAYDFRGHTAMSQIHTTVRSDAWIKYQGAMMDQVQFWGAVGAFNLVNDIPADTLNPAACPTGEVPQTETGFTDGYTQIMPTDPVEGSVAKFSHLIDLSLMPTAWWAAAAGSAKDGGDIRCTNTNNDFLPFDLIEFDAVAKTGLGVVKVNQQEGAPSAIRVWVGNATAISIHKCNVYGQYSAYDKHWRGFWPKGSGDDRTQYLNHLDATGDPNVVDNDSPVNGQATRYDNEFSTGQYAVTTVDVPTENPVFLMASVKKPTGALHTNSVIAAVQDADGRAASILHTRPSNTPARTTARNAFGTEATAGNSTTIPATDWWFQAGVTYGNNSRVSYVGDNEGSSSTTSIIAVVNNLDTFIVGAEYNDTPIRGMDATIALVGMHDAARGSAWISYWAKSLDQSTFWSVGAWVADPTALS